jgi:hypothetical protein
MSIQMMVYSTGCVKEYRVKSIGIQCLRGWVLASVAIHQQTTALVMGNITKPVIGLDVRLSRWQEDTRPAYSDWLCKLGLHSANEPCHYFPRVTAPKLEPGVSGEVARSTVGKTAKDVDGLHLSYHLRALVVWPRDEQSGYLEPCPVSPRAS